MAPRAALDLLRQVTAALGELARIDPSLDELRGQVEEQVYLLEDAAATLRDYRERVEADPKRLAEIEERFVLVKDLKRKYGATIEEILAFAAEAEAELAQIERSEERAEELRAREAELLAEIGRRAAALSEARREAGERLSAAVEASIAELNMGRARFAVQLTHADDPAGAPVPDPDAQRGQARERRLAFDERAAMLDGVPVTPTSRANARAMLDRATAWKAKRAAGADTDAAPATAPRGRAKAAARA